MFIGKFKETDKCHKTWYSKWQDLLLVTKLRHSKLKVAEWRSGVKVSDCIYDGSAKICFYHYQVYIRKYESRQTNCCNLF